MAALSTYLKTKLADHVFRGVSYAPPSVLYVSFHTADPTVTGLVGEVAGNNYSRAQVSATELYWNNDAGVVTNNVFITTQAASGAWGEITHFGIWDGAANANLLVFGALTSPKLVDEDNGISFPASFLSVTFS